MQVDGPVPENVLRLSNGSGSAEVELVACATSVAFGASVASAACAVASSVLPDRCQRVDAAAVAVAAVTCAGSAVAAGAAEAVGTALKRLAEFAAEVAPGPCHQARRWWCSCTVGLSWYNVCTASPPRT